MTEPKPTVIVERQDIAAGGTGVAIRTDNVTIIDSNPSGVALSSSGAALTTERRPLGTRRPLVLIAIAGLLILLEHLVRLAGWLSVRSELILSSGLALSSVITLGYALFALSRQWKLVCTGATVILLLPLLRALFPTSALEIKSAEIAAASGLPAVEVLVSLSGFSRRLTATGIEMNLIVDPCPCCCTGTHVYKVHERKAGELAVEAFRSGEEPVISRNVIVNRNEDGSVGLTVPIREELGSRQLQSIVVAYSPALRPIPTLSPDASARERAAFESLFGPHCRPRVLRMKVRAIDSEGLSTDWRQVAGSLETWGPVGGEIQPGGIDSDGDQCIDHVLSP